MTICAVCGKTCVRRRHESPRSYAARKFCSHDCARAARRMYSIEPKTCAICGALFERRAHEHPSHFKSRPTCSKTCGRIFANNKQRLNQTRIRAAFLQNPNASLKEIATRFDVTLGTICKARAALAREGLIEYQVKTTRPSGSNAPHDRPPTEIGWDVSPRQIACYCQASQSERRLFDPAIAAAAMRLRLA